MSQDTDHANLDQPRRKIVAWMPDFTAGNLTLILTVLGGFYHFGGTQATLASEQINMKAAAAAEIARSKEANSEVKQSVSAIDAKLSTVNDKLGLMAVTMAEIRATQQQRASK